jgi:hypothetical protein
VRVPRWEQRSRSPEARSSSGRSHFPSRPPRPTSTRTRFPSRRTRGRREEARGSRKEARGAGAAKGIPGTCDEIKAAQNELRAAGKQGYTGSNPIPTECEHAIRGGAYNYGWSGLRATNRVHHAGYFRINVLGFRCAKDAK